MAMLENPSSGTRHLMMARTLIGRSHACQIRLSGSQASGTHAEIVWDGECWLVHDLGSRNGTILGGCRLAPDRWEPLSVGSQLIFGARDERFVLVDASPPGLLVVGDDGSVLGASGGLLCLPSEDQPEVTLVEQVGGDWQLETAQGKRPVADQERISFAGRSFCVHLPGVIKSTDDGGETKPSVADVGLEFDVSRDEEHVQIQVRHGSRTIKLRPRAHDFFLLTLARARLLDQAQDGLDEREHGWLYRQDLARMLKVDRNLINLWVYRARRQFADAGVLDVDRLIERRRGAEQLRMGIARLRVSGRQSRGVSG